MTEHVPKKAEGIPRGVSEATIQRMLSLQESRITLELKQADIQLRDERAVNKTVQMHRLVFAAFIVMVTVALIVFALYIGKEAIVLDIVKVLCGFAGGYGVSSYISAKHKSQD